MNARADRKFPPISEDLRAILLHLMMRKSPFPDPPWETSRRLTQLVAGTLITQYRVLMMSDLRYASPLLLKIVGSIFIAVGHWKATGNVKKLDNLTEQLLKALNREEKLFEMFARDHILPPYLRAQAVQMLGHVSDVLIREGILNSIRENHPFISFATVIKRGSGQDLTFLGKLYRGIARYHSNRATDWCHRLLGKGSR